MVAEPRRQVAALEAVGEARAKPGRGLGFLWSHARARESTVEGGELVEEEAAEIG
jgi:hypothetical protein